MKKQHWLIHCCALDQECRLYHGWLWRVHINSPWWHFGVALRPKDKFGNDWRIFQRWPTNNATQI